MATPSIAANAHPELKACFAMEPWDTDTNPFPYQIVVNPKSDALGRMGIF